MMAAKPGQLTKDTAAQRLAGQYERAAPTWHARITALGYPDAYAQLARSAMDMAADGVSTTGLLRILDAGAGSGAFSLAFATELKRRNRTITPVFLLLEPSLRMLAEAGQRLKMADLHHASLQAGLNDGLLAEGSFDVILCSHVIEHMPDPLEALQLLYAALRPGGTLLLVVSKPHWCTTLLRSIWRHKRFGVQEIRAMLLAGGFDAPLPVLFEKGPPSRTSAGYAARRPAQ